MAELPKSNREVERSLSKKEEVPKSQPRKKQILKQARNENENVRDLGDQI